MTIDATAPHQHKLLAFLMGVPEVVTSNNDGEWFEKLTNLTQDKLNAIWVNNPTFTTCNALVGVCAKVMGVGLFESLDPRVSVPAQMFLGQFEIATLLAERGLSHAWVANANGAQPRLGDIFRCADYHMGVSLGVEGETFYSIEGGQNGKKSKFDSVKCLHELWGSRHILGWVDIATLLQDKTAAPDWLGGWWCIRESGMYYYFDNDGCVFRQDYKPLSELFAPPHSSGSKGGYSILSEGFRTVGIHWFDGKPDEKFGVHTSTEKIPGTPGIRNASKDELHGSIVGGKPINGNRLPGPWHT